MNRTVISAVVATALGLHSLRAAGNFAVAVVAYNPGANAAAGYLDPAAALGSPSTINPGDFGGPVDPFDPPYMTNQLVSLGAGGSLTVQFDQPISTAIVPESPQPFGLHFQIFGGAAFIITNAFDTNYNYIGTPATDGSLFSFATGPTQVSVSADGQTFYLLNPAKAPPVAGLYPTDGQGDFTLPVDPSLGTGAFAGQTLAGIRRLYGGSGGGTGYSIGWAQDDQGQPVLLESVQFVRVDVLSGRAQIDAFSAVEPPAGPPPLYLTPAPDGAIRLSWPAWAAWYTLQSSTNLTGGPWSPVGGVTNDSATVFSEPGALFFRLEPWAIRPGDRRDSAGQAASAR